MKDARWKSYQAYIFTLTRASPLGILPCVLGLSVPERNNLRAHYELLADRLKLGVERLAQQQPKTASSEQERVLQASVYFKDQQTLLHNFLRQVAALTQQSTHEALPVETPLTSMADHHSQMPSSTSSSSSVPSSSFSASSMSSYSSHSVSSLSSTASSSTSSVTRPSSTQPSASSLNLRLFQLQKPAVIKTETPPELKRCSRKFQKLFDGHKYAFTVKRASAEQLVLQFTAEEDVAEDSKEIKRQLQPAAIKLRQLVNASGLGIKPSQFELDWKTWMLTIKATSTEIDGVSWLLQIASGKFIIKDNTPSDHETTCRFQ